jgi:cytochrome c-type biogenesis protein CcmH
MIRTRLMSPGARPATLRPVATATIRWLFCLGFLVVALAAIRPAFAIDTTQFEDPELQERYLRMTHELRCMQCLNTSIADSQVNLAADLRREVYDLVKAGKSDDEIREFMVARYGEFILFRPLTNARNMWLWAGPFVFLAIGGIIAFRILRQRSKLAVLDDEPVEEEAGR